MSSANTTNDETPSTASNPATESNPDGTPTMPGKDKINLTQFTSQPIDKVEKSTPLKLNTDPNYLTHFCKNRNTPNWITVKNPLDFPDKPWEKYLGIAIVGGILLLFLLWILFKYYDLILPFSNGIFNILKYLVIYSVIVFILVLFFKFLTHFKFWYNLFMTYLKLFLNPLINEKVSFLYCYFTSYVNWLIYYPAKLFYLICLIGISLIFFLIIIPIIVAISFTIGYLFSLLGESTNLESLVNNMKKTASSVSVSPVKVSDLASQVPGAASLLSKVPGAASLLSKVPGASSLLSKVSGIK